MEHCAKLAPAFAPTPLRIGKSRVPQVLQEAKKEKLSIVFLILITFFLSSPVQAVEIEHRCGARRCEAFVSGAIDRAALSLIKQTVREERIDRVYLDSPGGVLGVGLKIGRFFRSEGITTIVQGADARPGRCESACAYAFLGGKRRIVPEGSKVGFHQFSFNGGAPALPASAYLSAGQKMSSEIINYLLEMGINPLVFVAASKARKDEMYFPKEGEMREYKVTTTIGFSSFRMEPYKDGMIAYSERRGAYYMSSYLKKLTFLCIGGNPHVVFFTPGRLGGRAASANIILHQGNKSFRRKTHENQMTVRANDEGTYFTIQLRQDTRVLIERADKIHFSLDYTAAEGGWFGYKRSLTDMDRKMIGAAFRFCI